MAHTSASTTSSHNSSSSHLHHSPSLDDRDYDDDYSGGKSTPIRTPSRSSSSNIDDDKGGNELDDDAHFPLAIREPPEAHREGDTKLFGLGNFTQHRTDTSRRGENDGGQDCLQDDDAFVLEQDPAGMSSWAGQPSIRGSSEAMRMVLLTFNTLGITYVASDSCQWVYHTDQVPIVASHGVLK